METSIFRKNQGTPIPGNLHIYPDPYVYTRMNEQKLTTCMQLTTWRTASSATNPCSVYPSAYGFYPPNHRRCWRIQAQQSGHFIVFCRLSWSAVKLIVSSGWRGLGTWAGWCLRNMPTQTQSQTQKKGTQIKTCWRIVEYSHLLQAGQEIDMCLKWPNHQHHQPLRRFRKHHALRVSQNCPKNRNRLSLRGLDALCLTAGCFRTTYLGGVMLPHC